LNEKEPRFSFNVNSMNGMLETSYGEIHYQIDGNGFPVVFLHGYLESREIWNDFIPEFLSSFQTIRIDIPGHGKSTVNFGMLTTEDMATSIQQVLESLSIKSAAFVGHSMGGYAALAFADLFPDMVKGLVLLHSHPNADSQGKIADRIADVERVEMGLFPDIVNDSIPRLFSNDNVIRFSDSIEHSKSIALKTPEIGVIAALRGMAARKDRNHIIHNLAVPAIMIFGAKDNLISAEMANAIALKHPKCQVLWLSESGHMGFIEEKHQTASAIMSFLTALLDRV